MASIHKILKAEYKPMTKSYQTYDESRTEFGAG
jgi:hypothetical protein